MSAIRHLKHTGFFFLLRVCADDLTPQQLFNLSAGLRGGELVNNVQSCLAHGVSHACTDAALDGRG